MKALDMLLDKLRVAGLDFTTVFAIIGMLSPTVAITIIFSRTIFLMPHLIKHVVPMFSGINYSYLQVAGICGAGQQHGWVENILNKGHRSHSPILFLEIRSVFWRRGVDDLLKGLKPERWILHQLHHHCIHIFG